MPDIIQAPSDQEDAEEFPEDLPIGVLVRNCCVWLWLHVVGFGGVLGIARQLGKQLACAGDLLEGDVLVCELWGPG